MAVFEHLQDMYDIRSKPRLLRSLMRDYLPDDKRPSPSPSKLSDVVSAIKTHGLLLESFREPVDQKQIDNWKSAIDAWVERLLMLVSSKMPDKCWAGTCLLGVTCEECSTDRFLASYSVWFQKLISQIQPPSDSHFVKVATCASLSDILTRLGGISNVKKDGTSHAGKLIQPVLKLLSVDSSEAVWVSTFIYNHGHALKMLREKCGGDLVRPGITRFATNYIALKSFEAKKPGLRAMFASTEWFAWRGSDTPAGRAARETINSEGFWQDVKKVVTLLEPLVKVLRMVDSEKKPTLPHLYAAIDMMKRHVHAAIPRGGKRYLEIIQTRWEKMLMHPMHKAAYYLNPKYQYKCKLGLVQELVDAVQVVEKLEPNSRMQSKCNQEEGAVVLLCTIITFFPYSIHRHYESAEAVIVSKFMSGKCRKNISKKLSHCLALLPKSRGDEDSWSLLVQKILISINIYLNHVFQGLEEETKCNEAMKCLVTPGKEPTPPLGGQAMSGEASDQAINMSEKLIIPRVSMLVLCCCTMLTNPYPVQVTVPVRPLLALVSRVLMVDGSLSKALLSFVTVMQQEYICSELPVLHSHCLDLLIAIIKGVRSQLLPHAADVVKLLTEYFRRCTHPSLRIKVYSIMQMLLISMGVGMALYLAQEVINNAFVDLDSVSHRPERESSTMCSIATTEALQQRGHRKRKHITAADSLEEHQNGVGLEFEVPENKPKVPTSVQIAALEALEVLLTVGGALRSEFWRANVDLLLITVATNACGDGWANEAKGTFGLSDEVASTLTDLQLAALRALLASLLSPAHVRPPYLSQGLELFRRGRQETGTKLAEFCAHAILVLEVLIHPRALPLGDFTSGSHDAFDERVNCRFPEKAYSGGLKPKSQFSRVIMGLDEPDPDDDLYKSWLGNGEETEALVCVRDEELENVAEPCWEWQTNGDSQSEKISSEHSGGGQAPEKGNGSSINGVDVHMGSSSDGIVVQSERLLESIPSGYVETLDKMLLVPTGSARGDEIEPSESALDGNTLDASTNATISSNISLDNEMNGKGATPAAGASLWGENNLLSFPSAAEKGNGPVFKFNSDSSMDSFPDIVNLDPDSE